MEPDAYQLSLILERSQEEYGPAESWTPRQVYHTLERLCAIGDELRADACTNWLDTVSSLEREGPKSAIIRIYGSTVLQQEDEEKMVVGCLRFVPFGAELISGDQMEDIGLCVYTKPANVNSFDDLIAAPFEGKLIHHEGDDKNMYVMDLTRTLTPILIIPYSSSWAEEPDAIAGDIETYRIKNGLKLLPEKQHTP